MSEETNKEIEGYIRITKEILTSTIANEESINKSNIEIIDFNIAPAVKKGENYSCTICKVQVKAKVNGNEKTYKYIGKIVPENEFRAEFTRGTKMFNIEYFVYSSLINNYDKLTEEYGCKKLNTPLCYYASETDEVLMFEDLTDKGYKMVKKHIGLDETHIYGILDSLAQLHAVSYKYLQNVKDDSEYERLFAEKFIIRKSFMPENPMTEKFEGMFQALFVGSGDLLISQGHEDLGQRLKKMGKVDHTSRLDNLAKIEKNDFAVIIHGDPWNNNFMFNYKDEKLSSVKILDLQLARYTKPTIDLAYFFMTSTDPIMRKSSIKKWLEYYYDHLCTYLNLYGFDPETVYSKDKFQKDWNDSLGYGFMVSLFLAQIVCTDTIEEGGHLDIDTFSSEEHLDKFEDKLKDGISDMGLNNELYSKRVLHIAQEAAENGFI